MTAVRRQIKKITNILSKEQTEIVSTALWLMIPSLLTKITGQLFNLVAASQYSTDDPRFEQFVVANAIPELLTTVLLVGAVGAIIIPFLLTCRDKDGEERFYRVFSSVLNVSVIIFTIITIFLVIFGHNVLPPLLDLLTSYEIKDSELDTIVDMMRVLLIPQIILGISMFISSGLNIYDRYLLPQLSPLVFNFGRLICIFTLLPLMDKSPWALVIGVIVGSVLHLLIQIPLFISLKIKYYPVLDIKDKYFQSIFKTSLPRMFSLASDQIGMAFSKFLAFAFQGASALTFATSLYLVVPSLFGYTFSTASYPTISRLFVQQDFGKIRNIINKTINEIFFLAIPFVVTIMVLRVPIVRLTYGIIPNTNLELDDTYFIAWILLWFTPGMVFITARWFVLSTFYALKDTITPLIITAFSLASFIGLSLLFTNFFSYNKDFAISSINLEVDNLWVRSDSPAATGGIALALSIVYTIEFFVFVYLLDRRKVKIGLRNLVKTASRKFIAGFAMFIFLYFTYKTWTVFSYLPETAETTYTGSTTLNLIILTTITVIPGFLIYYLICHLLKVEELKILRRYLNPIFKLGGLRIR